MSGFAHEMHARLHGILSDIVVESYETAGMPDATWHMEKIRSIVGADLEAITAVVHVPAMVNIPDSVTMPTAMAITLEPAGGVRAPTGEVYLLGQPVTQ